MKLLKCFAAIDGARLAGGGGTFFKIRFPWLVSRRAEGELPPDFQRDPPRGRSREDLLKEGPGHLSNAGALKYKWSKLIWL